MITATARTYRNAYAGLSKETWLLSSVMLINRSGTMVIPFMTLYLTSDKMGYSVAQAGLVFGLFGLGAFKGAWLGGKMTDRFGFYPVQLITLLGGGVMFFVLGQVKSYVWICICTYLLSFINEAFRPANSTAIAFYSKDENRTRSYALNRLAINLGWAVGNAIGGFLAHINYELLFWVDGCTNISAAMVMWTFLRPVNYKPSLKKETQATEKKRTVYHDSTYIFFVLITVLFASCFFQLFTNLPVYFKKDLHFSEPLIGTIMSANGVLIALLEMVLIYKLEGRRKNIVYISAGVLIIGAAFLLLNTPANPLLVASTMILLITFGEILSLPFMNTYWLGRTENHNRGQYAALYSMAWSAAQTLGPLAGAQLAQFSGFNVLWWVVGSVLVLTAFLFSRLGKKKTEVLQEITG